VAALYRCAERRACPSCRRAAAALTRRPPHWGAAIQFLFPKAARSAHIAWCPPPLPRPPHPSQGAPTARASGAAHPRPHPAARHLGARRAPAARCPRARAAAAPPQAPAATPTPPQPPSAPPLACPHPALDDNARAPIPTLCEPPAACPDCMPLPLGPLAGPTRLRASAPPAARWRLTSEREECELLGGLGSGFTGRQLQPGSSSACLAGGCGVAWGKQGATVQQARRQALGGSNRCAARLLWPRRDGGFARRLMHFFDASVHGRTQQPGLCAVPGRGPGPGRQGVAPLPSGSTPLTAGLGRASGWSLTRPPHGAAGGAAAGGPPRPSSRHGDLLDRRLGRRRRLGHGQRHHAVR
jgi:hypothetical protein